MTILLILVCVAGGLFLHNVKRGKTFVRAVDYLMMLDAGSSVEEANKLAAFLFSKSSNPDADNTAIHRAKALSDAHFGGKQLPLIKLARSKGFRG